MERVQVYDLPLRAFHWLFGILFIFSFSVGNYVDDDSWLYAYHMLSGITMSFMVVLRIIWGFVGSRYSRFSSFKLKPAELVGYFKAVISGRAKRELGHNSASSYAGIGMFFVTFLLLTSGLFMLNDIGDDFIKEVHEVLSLVFLIIVLFHIAGVVFHQFRNKDGLITSMFTGKKDKVEDQLPIDDKRLGSFFLFVFLLLSFTTYLGFSYNSKTNHLSLFGTDLSLGEKDNEHGVEYYNEYYNMNDKN